MYRRDPFLRVYLDPLATALAYGENNFDSEIDLGRCSNAGFHCFLGCAVFCFDVFVFFFLGGGILTSSKSNVLLGLLQCIVYYDSSKNKIGLNDIMILI